MNADIEKTNNIVLLDHEVDILDRNRLRLDMNVAFNQVPVPRGIIQHLDYYIGTTGAEITVIFNNCEVLDYTESVTIHVNHKNTTTKNHNSTVKIAPEISGINGLSTNIGNISFNEDIGQCFTATFSSKESIISPIHIDNFVRWIISLPRSEKAIRDFLLGNLYLYVECKFAKTGSNARIIVHPSDIRFFNNDKRPLGKMASMAMRFAIWKHGIRTKYNDIEISITFDNIAT